MSGEEEEEEVEVPRAASASTSRWATTRREEEERCRWGMIRACSLSVSGVSLSWSSSGMVVRAMGGEEARCIDCMFGGGRGGCQSPGWGVDGWGVDG